MPSLHRIYPPLLQAAREMRHPQTPAEATLWKAVRSRNLGYKFRRHTCPGGWCQGHPIDHFIVDFYCAEVKLCIEIDGSSHLEQAHQEYDAARTAWLEELGYQVIRFMNDDVRYNLNAVIDEILRVIKSKLHTPSPSQGEGRDEGRTP